MENPTVAGHHIVKFGAAGLIWALPTVAGHHLSSFDAAGLNLTVAGAPPQMLLNFGLLDFKPELLHPGSYRRRVMRGARWLGRAPRFPDHGCPDLAGITLFPQDLTTATQILWESRDPRRIWTTLLTFLIRSEYENQILWE